MSSSSAREAELEAKEAITQLHAQQKELYEQFGTLSSKYDLLRSSTGSPHGIQRMQYEGGKDERQFPPKWLFLTVVPLQLQHWRSKAATATQDTTDA